MKYRYTITREKGYEIVDHRMVNITPPLVTLIAEGVIEAESHMSAGDTAVKLNAHKIDVGDEITTINKKGEEEVSEVG